MSLLFSAGAFPVLALSAAVDGAKPTGMLETLHDPWVLIGICGSFVFGLRFVVQWIASERAKASVIPFGFWECSVLGAVLMLSSFLHGKNIVGLISTGLPLPIYLRNLYFRYSQKKPVHPGNEPNLAD